MALIKLNNQSLTAVSALPAGITDLTIDASGNVTMPNQPAFSAYKNGDQAITSGIVTKITGWTTLFDVGSNWDNANNRYIAPVSGVYLIHLCVQSNTVQGLHMRIEKNGSATWNGDAWLDGGDLNGIDNVYFAEANASDVFEAKVYFTTNANVNQSRTRFSVLKVA